MTLSGYRRPSGPAERRIPLFGLRITDATYPEAKMLLEELLVRSDRSRAVHFVNAHTLNLAKRDSAYHATLASAEHLLGDGSGVQLALRTLHGVQLRANLNGTDFVPYFLRETAGRRYRLFMLGTRSEVLRSAVVTVKHAVPGWDVCGSHHGYLEAADDEAVVELINRSRPHLLLVAMGNPRQELWIHRHLHQLEVPLSMGVGALFDYWGGAERRAPSWMCRADMEWIYRMIFQRGRRTRYLFGNPEFLWSVARAKWSANESSSPDSH